MSPSPKRCAERERLIDLLKAANQELTDIHQAEIVAALIGNLAGFESLRPRLIEGREQQDGIAESLRQHMRRHRC